MIYTLWLDHGYEGWHPRDFETKESLIDAIKTETYGNSWRITRELDIDIPIVEEDNVT